MRIIRYQKVRDGVEEHYWIHDRNSVSSLMDYCKMYFSCIFCGHLLIHGFTLFSPLFLLYLLDIIPSLLMLFTIILIYCSHYLIFKTHLSGNGWFWKYGKFCEFWEWSKYYTNWKTIRRGKTLDVANKQFIFAIAPHGILACNRVQMMGHIFFEEIYPCTFGRFAAATPQFYTPGVREISIIGGAACDASKKVCIKALNSKIDFKSFRKTLNFNNKSFSIGNVEKLWNNVKSNNKNKNRNLKIRENSENKESDHDVIGETKQSLYIWVGGSKELMTTDPNSKITKMVILDRKGFVKLAIECGIDIVPSVVFGEKYLYHKKIFPEWMRKILYKFKIPGILFYGRWGTLLPFNTKIDSTPLQCGMVFGEPICVEKQNPVQSEYLDKIHDQYIKQVQFLFDTYKDEMEYDEQEQLQFVNTTDV